MSEHTAEPWRFDRNSGWIVCADGRGIGLRLAVTDANPRTEYNARRIVACVNACKGLDIETLEAVGKVGIMAVPEALARERGGGAMSALRGLVHRGDIKEEGKMSNQATMRALCACGHSRIRHAPRPDEEGARCFVLGCGCRAFHTPVPGKED